MTFELTERQRAAKELVRTKKFILLAGGSRSGKTAFFVYYMVRRAMLEQCRQAILRFHFTDVKRSIGMDTLPKVLELMGVQYTLNKSDWIFYIPNEKGSTSEIWIGGLDDKNRVEKILGNQYSTVYVNEASQVSYGAYTTALTRLAENSGLINRVLIDCNPPEKSHWLYKMFILGKQPDTEQELINPELYGYLKMNPADNPYLPEDYIVNVLESLPDRQKKRFLYGEWLDKRQGALFTYEQIERARMTSRPDYLPYVVCAIDPAVTNTEESDETGIVIVGMDNTGDFYLMRDVSGRYTPSEWSERVRDVCAEFQVDTVVYETNQGGDMVGYTVKTANPNLVCQGVRATRGKVLRAEPVVSLYESGKVHHVGYYPELEEELTNWTPEDIYSPDRLDALVWGITYLLQFRRGMSEGARYPVRRGGGVNYPNGARSVARQRPITFGNGFRR